jgi:hypothetical protein
MTIKNSGFGAIKEHMKFNKHSRLASNVLENTSMDLFVMNPGLMLKEKITVNEVCQVFDQVTHNQSYRSNH